MLSWVALKLAEAPHTSSFDRFDAKDWEADHEKVDNGTIWGTPERQLRASIIKALAYEMGDVNNLEKIVQEELSGHLLLWGHDMRAIHVEDSSISAHRLIAAGWDVMMYSSSFWKPVAGRRRS